MVDFLCQYKSKSDAYSEGCYQTVALEDISLKSTMTSGIIGHTDQEVYLIQHLNGLLKPKSASNRGRVDITILRKSEEHTQTIGLVFSVSEYQLFEETVERMCIWYRIWDCRKKWCRKGKRSSELVGLSYEKLGSVPFDLPAGRKDELP